MPYPHVIRLRGPWDYEVVEARTGRASSGREQVPADWLTILGSDFSGRVRYRRYFNRPTGLESHEQVWLVVEENTTRATVTLNDRPVAGINSDCLTAEFDITTLIANRNALVIDADGPLAGEIRLEIRA